MHDGLQASVVDAVNARYQMTKAFKIIDVSDVKKDPEGTLKKRSDDIDYVIVKNGELVLGLLANDLSDVDNTASQLNKYIDKRFLLFSADSKISKVAGELKKKNIKIRFDYE